MDPLTHFRQVWSNGLIKGTSQCWDLNHLSSYYIIHHLLVGYLLLHNKSFVKYCSYINFIFSRYCWLALWAGLTGDFSSDPLSVVSWRAGWGTVGIRRPHLNCVPLMPMVSPTSLGLLRWQQRGQVEAAPLGTRTLQPVFSSILWFK